MKILIIDDDETILELLNSLPDPQNLEVVLTKDFNDGIKQISSLLPNLIIIDLMLPDINILQVCKQIRKEAETPILILSALDSPGLIAEALDAGADDYIIKPVKATVLLAHINQLMRRYLLVHHPLQPDVNSSQLFFHNPSVSVPSSH